MRFRIIARVAAIFLLLAYSMGTPVMVAPSASAAPAASMPMHGPACDSCGDAPMPASQCIVVCAFVFTAVGEPVPLAALLPVSLRPMSAAIPAGWSNPPDTAPPRV